MTKGSIKQGNLFYYSSAIMVGTQAISTNFGTFCPGSSDPPEKIFNIFASENEVYTIY